jgi:acetate kinase
LAVQIDEEANSSVIGSDGEISLPDAGVRTLVVHAREDLQIAAECREALRGSSPGPLSD